jgi:RNA polymerase sigma factor (sigma-70 family)
VTAIAVETDAHRVQWESAYRGAFLRVYRGLVAMGARPDEAEDALHDAFLKGLERSVSTSISSVDGWIFVVASRSWRRRRVRDRLLLPLKLIAEEAAPARDEAAADVFVALRALTLRQRQVLVLRFLIGMSQEETAELLGIARGTVAATTNQAISAMRLRMEVRR